MLLALPTLALADQALIAPGDMICMEVVATSPEHGATDVAVDHMPAALLQGGCVAQPVEYELLVDGEVVAFGDDTIGGAGLIESDHPLEPDTTYTWIIAPEGGSAATVEFTTGTRTASVPDLAFPELIALDVDHHRRNEWVAVDAEVELLDDPEGPFFVELVDEDGALWGVSHHLQGGVVTLSHGEPGAKPDVACLAVQQRAADGSWSSSETVCDEQTGCAAAALSATLGPSVLALLALRRRRCS